MRGILAVSAPESESHPVYGKKRGTAKCAQRKVRASRARLCDRNSPHFPTKPPTVMYNLALILAEEAHRGGVASRTIKSFRRTRSAFLLLDEKETGRPRNRIPHHHARIRRP